MVTPDLRTFVRPYNLGTFEPVDRIWENMSSVMMLLSIPILINWQYYIPSSRSNPCLDVVSERLTCHSMECSFCTNNLFHLALKYLHLH